jgi:predicted TIM-barrel fold metal-dependent hydrolase
MYAGVGASSPELGDSSSEFIYECVQQYPDRLFGWCSVVPSELDAPDRLEHYVCDMGFKGLKLHPPIQGFAPSDPRVFRTVRKAIEPDVPILKCLAKYAAAGVHFCKLVSRHSERRQLRKPV